MLAAQAIGTSGSFTEIEALNFFDNVVEMGHDGPAHLAVSSRDPLLRGLRAADIKAATPFWASNTGTCHS